jgi:hypothetical protein
VTSATLGLRSLPRFLARSYAIDGLDRPPRDLVLSARPTGPRGSMGSTISTPVPMKPSGTRFACRGTCSCCAADCWPVAYCTTNSNRPEQQAVPHPPQPGTSHRSRLFIAPAYGAACHQRTSASLPVHGHAIAAVVAPCPSSRRCEVTGRQGPAEVLIRSGSMPTCLHCQQRQGRRPRHLTTSRTPR